MAPINLEWDPAYEFKHIMLINQLEPLFPSRRTSTAAQWGFVSEHDIRTLVLCYMLTDGDEMRTWKIMHHGKKEQKHIDPRAMGAIFTSCKLNKSVEGFEYQNYKPLLKHIYSHRDSGKTCLEGSKSGKVCADVDGSDLPEKKMLWKKLKDSSDRIAKICSVTPSIPRD